LEEKGDNKKGSNSRTIEQSRGQIGDNAESVTELLKTAEEKKGNTQESKNSPQKAAQDKGKPKPATEKTRISSVEQGGPGPVKTGNFWVSNRSELHPCR